MTMESELIGEAGDESADDAAATTVDNETEIEGATEIARPTEPTSKLSIKGNGLSFEREVPESLALQLMQLVITGFANPSANAGGGMESRRDANGRRQSLPEYYQNVGPKRYREKLTTIAAYLHDVEGQGSFSADELKSQFRTVREAAPANFPRDLSEAIAKGWIAEERDQPGTYYVTRTGLEAVEDKFSANSARKPVRGRRKRASTKGSAPEAPINGE